MAVTGADIADAAQVIRDGGTVIYPTETCYGLGCDATNTDAVTKIYDIKERPHGKKLTVIVSDIEMAERYCTLTDVERRVVEAFMPGPLTLIAEKRDGFPDVTNMDFAFRIPGNGTARGFAREAGVPVVATSANVTGSGPYYRVADIEDAVRGAADAVLDDGTLDQEEPSTIIRIRDGTPAVLREGPVDVSDVEAVI